MIQRTLQPYAVALAQRHPIVTLTGPRQSGKTTLCCMAFPDKPYVSLEPLDERDFARGDPRGFLDRFRDGAVIDEVQRAPELLSYIQGVVDQRRDVGIFILTGSHNFGLLQAVTQTLAGRTALLQLLPLGLEEVRHFPTAPRDLFQTLWMGGYPRIHDRQLPADEWLANYSAAYVERDVRQLLQVGDLLTFQTFLRLAAGRTGQLLNLSGLGADCGVTHNTAKSWLSVLEASYIAFRLPPLHRNLGLRFVKTPKLHFYDSGLLCYLLGIRTPEQLEVHPLRGAVFETWAVAEILKQYLHHGQVPQLFFYRDRKGHEVDLIVERGREMLALEIKSGRTPSADYFSALEHFANVMTDTKKSGVAGITKLVLYGGEASQKRSQGRLLSWSDIATFPWVQ